MNHSKSNTRTVIILLLVVIAMFGFGFALVPLYSVFCKVTGLNGKTGGAVPYANSATDEDVQRWVTVEFDATTNANLPWQFYPLVRKIRLHPGENKRIAYFALNQSKQTMVVQAIPS